MRLLASACAVPLVIVAAPRRAAACSCAPLPPVVAPGDAASDVPLNTRVVARYVAPDVAIELRDASNELVATTREVRNPFDPFGATVFVTPATELAPNTTYTLTVSGGTANIASSFTTGTSIDMTPPAFTGISALALETMDWPLADEEGHTCVSSCIVTQDGRISRIRFDYADPPSDVVYLAMQLYRPGEDVVEELPVGTYSQRFFGFQYCAPLSPVLERGADYCARVVAYDIAGNIAGASSELCTTTQSCQPGGDIYEPLGLVCEPTDTCAPVSDAPASGGCSSSRAPAWLVALAALACVRRKRKGPERRSTLGPGFRDHPGR